MSRWNGVNDAYFYETRVDPRRRRRQWLALLLGLSVGIASGLYYTWQLDPVKFYDTDPVDLKASHQQTWILLVSAAYQLDGNLERANARLSWLQDPQIAPRVAELAQDYITQSRPAAQIRALALLADALGARTEQMLAFIATPAPTNAPLILTPAPTSAPPSPTSTASATPNPTQTSEPLVPTSPLDPTPTRQATRTPRPTATPIPPYALARRQKLCQNSQEQARIEIFVQTDKGVGIAGVEIWVTWSAGADRLVTGLKPDVGLGYADFDMQADVVYQVAVGDPAYTLASNLSIELCSARPNDTPLSSWRLTFVSTQSSQAED